MAYTWYQTVARIPRNFMHFSNFALPSQQSRNQTGSKKWRQEILLEFFSDKLQCVYIKVGCLLKDKDVNDSTKEETIEFTKD